MTKTLTTSQLLQLADLISNLPNTDNGTSDELAEWLEVGQVDYYKDHDDMKFMVYQTADPDDLLEPTELTLTARQLLKRAGNWKAAVAFALLQEYERYNDNVMPGKWARCETLSAIMGFDSGYTPGADYENFTESDFGVFFGSLNTLAIVTEKEETEYSISQFLEMIM